MMDEGVRAAYNSLFCIRALSGVCRSCFSNARHPSRTAGWLFSSLSRVIQAKHMYMATLKDHLFDTDEVVHAQYLNTILFFRESSLQSRSPS